MKDEKKIIKIINKVKRMLFAVINEINNTFGKYAWDKKEQDQGSTTRNGYIIVIFRIRISDMKTSQRYQ